jgi:hypothetical protein
VRLWQSAGRRLVLLSAPDYPVTRSRFLVTIQPDHLTGTISRS